MCMQPILCTCIHSYADFYKLPEPCDDIQSVLDSIAKRIGALTKGIYIYTLIIKQDIPRPLTTGGIYDHHRAARHFLQMYRDGKLGIMTLDH